MTPKYEEISLDISTSEGDIVLKFSRATREVLMTTDEARKHALQMIECADEIDKRKATESGIDTGNILPSR